MEFFIWYFIVITIFLIINFVLMKISNSDKNKKIFLEILKIAIVIFILWSLIFSVDYFRVKNDKLPIFCFKLSGLMDGGTIYYIGIGYKVIDFHALSERLEDVPHIIEKKYICPWSVTYEEALEKVKEELNI